MLGTYGTTFAIMALNFFILTTLDTTTRLGRYLLAELTGWENRYAPTLIVIVAAGALALSGQWRILWPAFGASNQLVAALTLLVVSCWLLDRGSAHRVTLIPALFMLATTLAALVWQIHAAITGVGRDGPDWFLAGLCAVLIVLALAVALEARSVLWRPARSATTSA
jgi:carbon starvation protein